MAKGEFIYPEKALNNDVPVNLTEIDTFNTLDKPDPRNKKTRYSIVFNMPLGPDIEWRYDNKKCRDSEYTRVRNEVTNINNKV